MTDGSPIANVEAEAAFIGALLIDNRILDTIAAPIAPVHFFEPVHQRIMTYAVALISAGKIASPVTVKPFMDGDPDLQELGGPVYLARLTADPQGLLGPNDLAEQIIEMHTRRLVRERIIDAARDCADMNVTIPQIAATIESAAMLDTASDDGCETKTAGQFIDDLFANYSKPTSGVTTNGKIAVVDEAIGPLQPGQMIVVAARPGMGKAQPLNARVLTTSGWKTMGEIALGDRLASVDGKPSVVTGIYPQGVRKVYRVALSDGRSTECCGEHLWEVRHREWKRPRVLSTDKIADMLKHNRYKNRLSITTFSGDYGNNAVLPVDPWLFGFLLGDGYAASGTVRFSSADPDNIRRVNDLLPEGLTVVYAGEYNYRISGGYRGGTENPIMAGLREAGVADCHSFDKFIPEIYLSATRRQRIELLRGIMDSDGWVEKHGSVRFSTASRTLAENVQQLIRSIGGLCSISVRQPYYTHNEQRRQGRPAYMCKIRLSDPSEVFSLERKRSRAVRKSNTVTLTFQSIEYVRDDVVQCIAVSHPRHLYVTDEFVVTHNTAFAVSHSLGAAAAGHPTLFVSLEMRGTELAGRQLADWLFDQDAESNLSYFKIRTGFFSRAEKSAAAWAAEEINQLPLEIFDGTGVTLSRLDREIRKARRKFEAQGKALECVFVDHIGLLQTDERRRSEYEKVSEISRTLKMLAKRHNVAIVVLCQLSRAVEQRADHRPTLSDLRDSGQIEQDADTVMFLLREAYYKKLAEPPEGDEGHDQWEREYEAIQHDLDFIVAKVRNGVTRVVRGSFFGEYQAVRG